MAATTDVPEQTDEIVPSDRPRAWWPAAVAGAVAAAVALGLSELVAGLISGVPSLVVAVGNGVVDLGAGSRIKELAIAVFGTNDKTALVVGTVILALLSGAALGVLARRRGLGAAALGFVGFAALGVGATTANPLDSAALALLPATVAAGSGIGTLWWLLDLAQRYEPAQRSAGGWTRGRREFLRISVGVTALAGVLGAFGRTLSTRSIAAASRDSIQLPGAAGATPTAPEGTAFEGIEGLTSLYTPNETFYRIDTALTTPMVDVEAWSLRIHGMVDREVVLTYADLAEMEQVEADITIACVSNEVGGDLVGNARWQGVRLADVLDTAGVAPGADQVVGRSVDGWTAGFPTDVVYDGRDTIIALGMNGEPLPLAHGFPARLIVPGLYGYVSATKWLQDIELTTWEAFDGYWVPRGWSKEGPIKTQSRIDVPKRGQRLEAGEVVVAGVAWAQRRGITGVEVQVDDGEWQQAEVGEELNVDTWRQWRFRWEASTGQHTLRVRATDGDGNVQSGERVPVAPNGAEGYHTRLVSVS